MGPVPNGDVPFFGHWTGSSIRAHAHAGEGGGTNLEPTLPRSGMAIISSAPQTAAASLSVLD
jgi:hypothetical protein